MERTTHLSDYFAILRRRRRLIIRTALVVFGIGVAMAVLLPSVYRSTATLLIEQQEVPPDLVPSTVTGYVNQRMRVIETRVLTPANLVAIATKADLYAKERAAGQDRAIAGKMRSNIKIETVSANVTDPRSGQANMATISFNVSYDARSPEVAQKVAEELAALFINENRAVRTQKAERASGFLSDEEEKLRTHINDLEAKLATYKEKNAGRLPELMNLNMQMLERAQKEVEEADRNIYNLEERKLQLQSQLGLVEPHTGNSPGGRLREVQTEYLRASSIYSPDHPDVARLKRELDNLKSQTGISGERAALETQYKAARQDLEDAREKYAPDHPDVMKLQRRVSGLEARLAKAPAAKGGFAIRPDNPAYVALQTQLDTVDLNLRAAKEQKARATQKIAEYEDRVVQTPRVEQEGLALQREYESTVKKYRELKQSLMGANLAVELERDQRGERYSLLEPPELPDAPDRPNRKAFLLLGLVLGIGSGIGYASIAEYMDRTIRGSHAVSGLLRAPPLAVIPYIPNGIDPPYRSA